MRRAAYLCFLAGVAVMAFALGLARADEPDLRWEAVEVEIEELCRYSCRDLSWREAQGQLVRLIREVRR